MTWIITTDHTFGRLLRATHYSKCFTRFTRLILRTARHQDYHHPQFTDEETGHSSPKITELVSGEAASRTHGVRLQSLHLEQLHCNAYQCATRFQPHRGCHHPRGFGVAQRMGSRYRDRPQMRTDHNVKICEGRNSTRRSSRAPPHFREKGLAALGSIQNQASLLDRNARSAGSEGQPSALHFTGNSQEWRLLILMSGPLEAGKRLCWKLFEERMRVSGGGGTEMRAQRGYGRDRCRGGEPEKRRLLPRGHFYITDCMTGTFKSPGNHRCIPGAPNTSLVQNLIP